MLSKIGIVVVDQASQALIAVPVPSVVARGPSVVARGPVTPFVVVGRLGDFSFVEIGAVRVIDGSLAVLLLPGWDKLTLWQLRFRPTFMTNITLI